MVSKMFVVLGLTWIMDIITFALKSYDQTSTVVFVLAMILEIINSLQGVILFVVIFFNSKNIMKICCWHRGRELLVTKQARQYHQSSKSTELTATNNLVPTRLSTGANGKEKMIRNGSPNTLVDGEVQV